MGKEHGGVIDHLGELRKRFFRIGIFFLVTMGIAFVFVPEILEFLTENAYLTDVDLNVFNITDPLMLYLKISSMVAIVLVFPYILLEMWFFIKPGLLAKEKKYIRKYVPLIFIFFITGIAFSYFILIPYYIKFSQGLAGNTGINIVMDANNYIDFFCKMLLYFGFVFQLPVLALVLSFIGIISSGFLKQIRKYAYFILLISAAFLTPPDLVSMTLAVIPLGLLYEISILMCRISEKKKLKRNEKS